ncbi:hypothetical protein [Caballeronia ptereochthonis]|uniref:Lipoprotein n=1 Tax=Caballeronia ptereochthonis TaxID=1777144 RepID=A0A158B1J3_9BURK|nr:hypothetical protein [Caballeronia ptereochthonis]SAK64061.1 hypothetical protein AWB83_02653 [Caballeronia ptereochthonis]
MKCHQTKRPMFLAITLLALGAACGISVAATNADNADASAADAALAANAMPRGAKPIGVDDGPLTLTVRTPSGGTSRLTYADEDGWRLDDRDARLRPNEARITPASAEPQKEASAAERPMTVFIDGPTGFTYVWMRDQGWKFVGKLADRNR